MERDKNKIVRLLLVIVAALLLVGAIACIAVIVVKGMEVLYIPMAICLALSLILFSFASHRVP